MTETGGARVPEIDPPFQRSIGRLKLEGAGQPLDSLPLKETGQELHQELFDTCSSNLSIDESRFRSAVCMHGMLGVVAVDPYLHSEAPAPPPHILIACGGEGPHFRVRFGCTKHIDNSSEGAEIPG
jgi:hypothetical protein